ncbi:unnamed protein product [Clavelina lepadiformis]|uniref:XPG N-terminal domain-containing protein n=2 Tax=Clavelina lepadiformis TaxID=159417 RepID=A0ABP0GP42_CLALP
MGIKGFQTFLEKNQGVLSKVKVSNTTIVIDGSELLYTLHSNCNAKGRGNYRVFREQIMKFVKNMQKCRIKPIIIFDGFKFEDNHERYIERRQIRIGRPTKAYFCEMVLRQTLTSLKVAWSNGRKDTDEDIAAISKLLDAPVVSNDTIFCAYNLEAGFLPLRSFKWKEVRRGSVMAQKFQIDNFAETYNMDRQAMSAMAPIFDNNDFQNFVEIRQMIKVHNVSKYIDWSRRNNLEEIVENLMSEEIRNKLQQRIEKHQNPRVQANLLRELKEKLPEENKTWLEVGQDRQENEEINERISADLICRINKNDLPYWIASIMIQQKSGGDLVRFLPLINSDPPQFPSPHESTKQLRKVAYQVLIGEGEINEFDRVQLRYEATEPISVERNLDVEALRLDDFEPNASIIQLRREFLLQNLIEDVEKRDLFFRKEKDLSDDLKLVIPATIFWMEKCSPPSESVQALAAVFALTQDCFEGDQVRPMQRKYSSKPDIDSQFTFWFAQWQVTVGEAIAVVQLLGPCMPIPIIASLFDEDTVKIVYDELQQTNKIDWGAKGEAEQLYNNICSLLF